jgi:HK97 family phage prohead protease
MREREFASFGVELAQVEAKGRTLEGYASVFDHPIDSGTAGFPQTTFVRPGAFTKTLKENRAQVKVLFNHGLDPRYGKLPIGVPTELRETPRGLFAKVKLHDGPDNQNIIAALEAGALNAMSIQFETTDEGYNEDRSERYIQAVKLYEFGPVTFPANEAATASLHSLPDIVPAMVGDQKQPTSTEEPPQAETSEAADRDTQEGAAASVDPDRLTWSIKATRTEERYEAEWRELDERIARL